VKFKDSADLAVAPKSVADLGSMPLAPSTLSYAEEAIAHLRSADPIMAAIIDRVGPLKINYRRERFPALVQAIIFQQLAGRAAQTIHDRFVLAIGGGIPTPEAVLAATDEALRGAGLSRGKMAYIRDLASHVQGRLLDFKRFPRMTDDEVVAHLTCVKGIGRWTAEIFMMFNLRRPDILPVDDLGVRMAVMKAYGLPVPPPPKELREFGERWKPHRTAAAWYLWRSLQSVTVDTAAKVAKAATASPKARASRIAKSKTLQKAVLSVKSGAAKPSEKPRRGTKVKDKNFTASKSRKRS
jgi:DNA-3-methyladenine glycosylase II